MSEDKDVLVQKKKEFTKQLDSFNVSLDKKLQSMGLVDMEKFTGPNELVGDVGDISKVSDNDLGRYLFAATQMFAYVSSCRARADVERKAAEEAKLGAFNDALLLSDRSSVEDRKAEAGRDLVYRAWNMLHLEKEALYRRLEPLTVGWQRRAEAYSREITNREHLRRLEFVGN